MSRLAHTMEFMTGNTLHSVLNLGEGFGTRKILHVVGPDCKDAVQRAESKTTIKSAVRASLDTAWHKNIKILSIPPISCGNFKMPEDDAAVGFFHTIMKFARKSKTSFLHF